MISQFKPPYDESFQVPDPTVAQVLVQHTTTHTYASPGEGGPLPCQPPLGKLCPGGSPPSSKLGFMAQGLTRVKEGCPGVRSGLDH